MKGGRICIPSCRSFIGNQISWFCRRKKECAGNSASWTVQRRASNVCFWFWKTSCGVQSGDSCDLSHCFFQRSRHSISTVFIIQLRSLSQSKFEYLSSTRLFKSQYFHRYQWWSFFFSSVSMFQFSRLFRKLKWSIKFFFRRYNGCTQEHKKLYIKLRFQIQNWKLKNDHHSFLEQDMPLYSTHCAKVCQANQKWLFSRHQLRCLG